MTRINTAELLLVCCLISAPALAQQVSYLQFGTVEVGAFGGFTGGLGRSAAGVGGNVSIAANRYLLPYFEVTYFPDLLNRAATERLNSQGLTATVRRRNSFTDLHGGLHLRIPFTRRPEIMPYAAFGLGVLRKSAGEAEIVDRLILPDPPGTDFAVNFGGGLRWYVRHNLGTRVEMKGYIPRSPVGAFNDSFVKVTFGIFFIWNH